MKLFSILFCVFIIIFSDAVSQIDKLKMQSNKVIHFQYMNEKLSKDSTIVSYSKKPAKKANIGGIFLSPSIGVIFPFGTFYEYSSTGVIYGIKAEFGFSKLYPFIPGFVYEYQKNPGNGEYLTTNSLTLSDTKITYIGGSLDIVLNKYLQSNFTTPVFSLEIKYANIVNEISPQVTLPNRIADQSLLTYSLGLGFTVYIFDLGGKYTFAGDFSNLTFQAKIHIPLIRF